MTTQASSILIVGGTGATGQHVVRQLLDRGHRVKIIARSPERLSESVRDHEHVTVVQDTVLDMTPAELSEQVRGCDAMVSCLGHRLSWSGVFGPPRRLVADSVERLCRAAQSTHPEQPVRLVLMNSTGCRNRDVPERVSLGQRIVVRLIRTLVPPHADNEAAMEFLRSKIGRGSRDVQWVIVRPDSLIDEEEVTPYDTHASPIRSAIFNPGKTSRINAAIFMAELATDPIAWSRWVGQMPVIYNRDQQ